MVQRFDPGFERGCEIVELSVVDYLRIFLQNQRGNARTRDTCYLTSLLNELVDAARKVLKLVNLSFVSGK